MRDVLRTALCDLLGIEYPIIQSGMGNVAGPDLVAEVSRAGGLGVLADRKSTRLNSSHIQKSRMPSSA